MRKWTRYVVFFSLFCFEMANYDKNLEDFSVSRVLNIAKAESVENYTVIQHVLKIYIIAHFRTGSKLSSSLNVLLTYMWVTHLILRSHVYIVFKINMLEWSDIEHYNRVRHMEKIILAKLASDFYFILAKQILCSPIWRVTWFCTRQIKICINSYNWGFLCLFYNLLLKTYAKLQVST